MATFVLTGDIAHGGHVEVEADTFDGALAKAEEGHFRVVDEDHKNLGFTWTGDPSSDRQPVG